MKLSRTLELLGDGKWHTMSEIMKRSETDRREWKQVMDFLREYNFIVVDEEKRRVRLKEEAERLLTRTASS
jgi:DNA-binding IclR family transcriptional regulator